MADDDTIGPTSQVAPEIISPDGGSSSTESLSGRLVEGPHMAKARLISCSLSTSKKFNSLYKIAGALAEFTQSLYPLIVIHCDDFGRMAADGFTVKMRCHPGSPRTEDDFSSALRFLQSSGMIQVDSCNSGLFLQIADFDEHQSGLHKRTSSKFPEIPRDSGKVTEIPSELNRTELELNGTEQIRTEVVTDALIPQNAPVTASPTFGGFRSKRSPSLLGGPHPNCHVGTWEACARGMCVPPFLVEQWKLQLGTATDPTPLLRSFVDETLAAHPQGVPFGDEPLKYWRGKWAERHGTTLQSNTKAGRTIAGARKLAAQMIAEGKA